MWVFKIIKKTKAIAVNIKRQKSYSSHTGDAAIDFVKVLTNFKSFNENSSILKIDKKDDNIECYFENMTYESLIKFEVSYLSHIEMQRAFNTLLTSLITSTKLELTEIKND